jgi:hypothetical protein
MMIGGIADGAPTGSAQDCVALRWRVVRWWKRDSD